MVNLRRVGLDVVQLHPAGRDGTVAAPRKSGGVFGPVDMQRYS